jgi:hypothetical protein
MAEGFKVFVTHHQVAGFFLVGKELRAVLFLRLDEVMVVFIFFGAVFQWNILNQVRGNPTRS